MKQPELQPAVFQHWNPAVPRQSFECFAKSIHEQARNVLLKGGHHLEEYAFMLHTGQCYAIIWDDKDRASQFHWTRKHIHDNNVYGVVHIYEVRIPSPESERDHALKGDIDGRKRVSVLRFQERADALTITAETRDGYRHAWTDEILVNEPDGRLYRGSGMEFVTFEDRFGKMFP